MHTHFNQAMVYYCGARVVFHVRVLPRTRYASHALYLTRVMFVMNFDAYALKNIFCLFFVYLEYKFRIEMSHFFCQSDDFHSHWISRLFQIRISYQ
jgi:hypothetical protein